MNIQTASQRFRYVPCLVRQLFGEIFYLNLWLYMETPCLCASEEHIWRPEANRTMSSNLLQIVSILIG